MAERRSPPASKTDDRRFRFRLNDGAPLDESRCSSLAIYPSETIEGMVHLKAK